MAEDKQQVILDVEVNGSKAVKEIADLKQQVDDLKTAQQELDLTTEQGREQYVAYDEQIKALKKEISSYSKAIQDNIKLAENAEGSYNALSAELAQLKVAYKAAATDEDRQAILVHLKEVNDQLVELDKQQGVFVRNVGNYPKTVTAIIPGFDKLTGALDKLGLSLDDLGSSASSAFKAVGSGMKNLGKQAMSMLANPIIAAIAAVLVVLKMLYDAFQRSEQAQLAWQKMISPFKAMWQNLQRVFDDIVKLIMKVGDAFGANGKILQLYMRMYLLPLNAAITIIRIAIANLKQTFEVWSKIFKAGFDAAKSLVKSSPLAPYFDKVRAAIDKVKNALAEFIGKVKETANAIKNSKVGQFLGLAEYEENIKGIILSNQELIDSNNQIAESEAAIQKQRTANMIADADAQKEIAELKAKVAEKDKYTSQERLAMLEQANAKEEEIAKRALELAKAQYEAEKLRNSLTESNAEDLEREAQAYAAMVAAETALFNKQKELNGQMAALRQEQANDEKKKAEEAKKRREKANEEAKKAAALRLEIQRALEDAIIALDADEVNQQVEQRRVAGQREIENLKLKMKELKKNDTVAREALQKLIIAKEKETQQEIDKILLTAAMQRAEAIRNNAYAEQELLTSDSLQLAQLRKTQAQESLAELLNLSKEQQGMLYANEEEYNAAVLAARKRLSDETLAVAQETYNQMREQEELETKKRLDAAKTNAIEQAKILLEQAQNEHDQLLNMDDETKQAMFKSQQEYEAAVIESSQRVLQAQSAVVENIGTAFSEWGGKAMETLSAITSAAEEAENQQMQQFEEDNDRKKQELEKRLEDGIISQEEYDARVTALDADYDKKKKELEMKQAKRQKAMAIMNATLNAAGAIIASLAQSPVAIGPIPNPAGIASLALATATGIAQIAAAAATPLPKASKGMLITGPSHAQGGTLIEAEGGEAIINKRATSRFLPLLSRINQSTGGIPLYGSGGVVGEAKIEQASQTAAAAAEYANRKIYVAVTDINAGQSQYAEVQQMREF